jgi:dGTP triphosphohydrolase
LRVLLESKIIDTERYIESVNDNLQVNFTDIEDQIKLSINSIQKDLKSKIILFLETRSIDPEEVKKLISAKVDKSDLLNLAQKKADKSDLSSAQLSTKIAHRQLQHLAILLISHFKAHLSPSDSPSPKYLLRQALALLGWAKTSRPSSSQASISPVEIRRLSATPMDLAPTNRSISTRKPKEE